MLADQHRGADRAGLDQVLAAERQQAASDERDVGSTVVGEHLAERIAEHDANARLHRRIRGAPRIRHATGVEQAGDGVEALRVARHDDDERRGRKRCARKRVEQQRFLAVARRREHQHRAFDA